MRLEQRTRIPGNEFKPLLLPGGGKIYPMNDEPPIMIIRLLIKARGKEQPWISGDDTMKALKLKYPDISDEKLRTHIGTYVMKAAFILKRAGFAIIGEETILRGTDGQKKRLHHYTLGTIEEKKAHNPTKKTSPNKYSYGKPPKLRTVTPEKQPTAKFELPEQEKARLAKEAKETEEKRKVFISKFSRIIVSQIANNPDNGFHHFASLDKNLEPFLEKVDPSFRELIDGNSVSYLRDFVLEALTQKLTQWWNIEKPLTVPALEQSAVENCSKLKDKGFNAEDVLNKAVKHFSIPIASVKAFPSLI